MRACPPRAAPAGRRQTSAPSSGCAGRALRGRERAVDHAAGQHAPQATKQEVTSHATEEALRPSRRERVLQPTPDARRPMFSDRGVSLWKSHQIKVQKRAADWSMQPRRLQQSLQETVADAPNSATSWRQEWRMSYRVRGATPKVAAGECLGVRVTKRAGRVIMHIVAHCGQRPSAPSESLMSTESASCNYLLAAIQGANGGTDSQSVLPGRCGENVINFARA